MWYSTNCRYEAIDSIRSMLHKLGYFFLVVAFMAMWVSALWYALVTLSVVLFIWVADWLETNKNRKRNK